MAFDGAFLHTLLETLNSASGSHTEKIYQPSRDELVIYLKKKDFSGKLFITARNGSARINFTKSSFENPQSPPMFCMLARKIFLPSRFIGATQKGLERVIELNFEAVNELGDTVRPKIICEFIGGSSNIILADENGRIYDAVNRTDITASRLIMPGSTYEYPQNRGKLNILETNAESIIDILKEKNCEISSALGSVLDGLSPLVCREICFRAFGSTDVLTNDCDLSGLIPVLSRIKDNIERSPEYTALYENGVPKEFSFIDIKQYGSIYENRVFESADQMLDEFYFERDLKARIKKQNGDIIKTVNNLLNRTLKRTNIRIKELEETKDREKLRIYGELIKANIHLIKPGDSEITVQNFYDENLVPILIKLDPSKNPSANAARYFKDYKKSCAKSVNLAELIEKDKLETEYLDSVLEALERAKTSEDINGIREELVEAGYIKSKTSNKKKKQAPKIEEYTSKEGYKILVGRNNIQNDYITTRLADKNDTWFHTKNIHGSHIIVKNGGKDISDETLEFASKLAAKNSRAKNSANVPVDYTAVKYVKKPAGAKPGMVIYTTNKTLFVTPLEE